MINTGIAVAAAVVLLVVRPLTAGVIIWTTVVALLLLLAVLLASRPIPLRSHRLSDAVVSRGGPRKLGRRHPSSFLRSAGAGWAPAHT